MVCFGNGDFFPDPAGQPGLAQLAQMSVERVSGCPGDVFQILDGPWPAREELNQGEPSCMGKRLGEGQDGIVAGKAPERLLYRLQDGAGGGDRAIGHGAVLHE